MSRTPWAAIDLSSEIIIIVETQGPITQKSSSKCILSIGKFFVDKSMHKWYLIYK